MRFEEVDIPEPGILLSVREQSVYVPRSAPHVHTHVPLTAQECGQLGYSIAEHTCHFCAGAMVVLFDWPGGEDPGLIPEVLALHRQFIRDHACCQLGAMTPAASRSFYAAHGSDDDDTFCSLTRRACDTVDLPENVYPVN